MDYKEAGAEFSALVKTVLERSKVTYEVFRIETRPAPGEPIETNDECAMLSFRATFFPTQLVVEWSCGSGVPLRAYEKNPEKWNIHDFIGTSHTGREDILKSVRRQGRISIFDSTIRNVVRRGFEPLPEDVLSSAVRDFAYDEGARSLEDWLDQLQTEPPRTGHIAEWLRYWRGNFERFVATEKPLKALFGPDWDRAVELTQHM